MLSLASNRPLKKPSQCVSFLSVSRILMNSGWLANWQNICTLARELNAGLILSSSNYGGPVHPADRHRWKSSYSRTSHDTSGPTFRDLTKFRKFLPPILGGVQKKLGQAHRPQSFGIIDETPRNGAGFTTKQPGGCLRWACHSWNMLKHVEVSMERQGTIGTTRITAA